MPPHSPTSAATWPRTPSLLLIALAGLLTACGNLVDVEPHEPVTLPTPDENSVVVDAEGGTLAELHAGQDRQMVAYPQLPEVLIDAVVAIEDHRYWSHGGVDAPSVLRALGVNIRAGDVVQGGSTITQQLAKISLVGSEQSLARKAVEASVALQLEARFSKRELLTQYLNTVYFGQGAYGAQTAAQRYFGIDVSELDLGQAATLAGLLRAPSRDNPLVDPGAAEARRDVVLDRMVELGHIDAQRARAARHQPLEVSPPEPEDRRAPYFVDHVLETIQHDDAFAALGDTPDERARRIYRGGLRIETTLDPDWQAVAERAVAATLTEEDDPHAAVVALEPSSGALRALVGGRGYDDPGNPVARLNLATRARRQPGSAFKPLTLAAALTRGHSLDEAWAAPATLTLPADPPHYPRAWSLSNHSDAAFGRIDLRQATWYSVNTVYAQLAHAVGPAAVADLAQRAGVGRDLPAVRSISIGSVEVTPLELARVNATFANGGVRRDTRLVTRIEGPDGEVLWQPSPSQGTRVMDRGVAWMTTQALQGVIAEGTGQVIDLDRPVAGKTGTTDDYADAWFAGYTPDMAVSVWVGFPQGRVSMVPPRTRRRVQGGTWPAEIFDRTLSKALTDTPPAEFPVPRGSLATVDVDVSRGCRPNPHTRPGVVERQMFLAGTQPTETCDEPTRASVAEVPDVTGLTVDEAEQRLDRRGFTVTRRARYREAVEPGRVVDQTPRAGRHRLEAGRRIALWVATDDPTSVDIPDVLGMTAQEAVAELRRGGFAARVVTACPDAGDVCDGARQRAGTVWQQDPAQTARAGSTVEVSVYPKSRPDDAGAGGDDARDGEDAATGGGDDASASPGPDPSPADGATPGTGPTPSPTPGPTPGPTPSPTASDAETPPS